MRALESTLALIADNLLIFGARLPAVTTQNTGLVGFQGNGTVRIDTQPTECIGNGCGYRAGKQEKADEDELNVSH